MLRPHLYMQAQCCGAGVRAAQMHSNTPPVGAAGDAAASKHDDTQDAPAAEATHMDDERAPLA